MTITSLVYTIHVMPVNVAQNAAYQAGCAARLVPDETAQDAAENRARQATFTPSPEAFPNGIEKTAEDVTLIGMAVKRRWGTSRRQRKRAIARLMRAVDGDSDPRAIQAIAVLIAAERADNARLFAPGARAQGQSQPTVNVTVQVAAREAAVFGEITAFRRAAEHAANSAQITQDQSKPVETAKDAAKLPERG